VLFLCYNKTKKEKKMEIIRDKEELKKKIDLAEYIGRYVDLQPRGNTLVGASPVRAERTPSFYVIPSKGIWKDFAGGTDGVSKKGGDIFEFYRYAVDPKASFLDAVREVAKAYGYTYAQTEEQKKKFEERGKIGKLMNDFQTLAVSNLKANHEAMNYLKKERGLSEEAIERHGLGFCTLKDLETLKKKGYTNEDFEKVTLINRAGYPMYSSRITIPVKNDRGEIVSYVGRATRPEEKIKYLNARNTEIYERGSSIYAPEIVGKGTGFGTIVEGTFDAMALAGQGFEAYAFLGTEAAEKQLDIVAGKHGNVLIMTDGDEAGQTAMMKLSKEMLSRGCMVMVAKIPDGKDPADYFLKEGNSVKDFLKNGNAKDIFDAVLENQDFGTLPGRREAGKAIEPLLEACDMAAKDWYSKKFAEKIGVDTKDARKLFPKVFGEGELDINEEPMLPKEKKKGPDFYEKPTDPVLIVEEELVRMALHERFVREIIPALSNDFYKNLCLKLARNSQVGAGMTTGMDGREIDFLKQQRGYNPKYSSPEECVKEHRLLVVKKELDMHRKAVASLEKELAALEKNSLTR
jgi:DNA primase (bacterial type)